MSHTSETSAFAVAAALVALESTSGDWREHGLCRQVDPELFHPDRAGGRQAAAAAKRVCTVCPVRRECLDEALRRREPHGVWGGTTAQERAQLLRARRTGGRRAA